MSTMPHSEDAFVTGDRRHRRIAYRGALVGTFTRDADSDMIDGEYRDSEGDVIGPMLTEQRRHEEARAFLVIPNESIPLVHVEAALEGDHRVGGYEQVFALLYRPGETPVRGVHEMGDRWDDGELVAYTFETDDEALEAQG
ncbi:MAG: hypothetical protein ABI577_15965 [bacterium]